MTPLIGNKYNYSNSTWDNDTNDEVEEYVSSLAHFIVYDGLRIFQSVIGIFGNTWY